MGGGRGTIFDGLTHDSVCTRPSDRGPCAASVPTTPAANDQEDKDDGGDVDAQIGDDITKGGRGFPDGRAGGVGGRSVETSIRRGTRGPVGHSTTENDCW